MEPKCLIVSGGSYEPVLLPRGENDCLIACDRGYAYCEAQGVLPDLILGDFDSAAEHDDGLLDRILEIQKQDPNRVRSLPTHKDDTDTLAAVRVGLDGGYRLFYLYGTLGGSRLSHSVANIQTLLFLKAHGAKGYLMDAGRIIFVLQNESVNLHRGTSGFVSIFCLGDKAEGVTLSGLAYELEDAELTDAMPLGVSNELLPDQEAVISVKHGKLLVVLEFES